MSEILLLVTMTCPRTAMPIATVEVVNFTILMNITMKIKQQFFTSRITNCTTSYH